MQRRECFNRLTKGNHQKTIESPKGVINVSQYDQLKQALDQANNEREIGEYLKGHKNLLYALNEHSWNCVKLTAEFPIGTKYRADYMILSACSGYWNCVLVEMQSPKDKIFTKKQEFSAGLREGFRQVEEWQAYISMNEAAFRDQLADLAADEPAYCSNAAVHTRASSEIRDPRTVIYYRYKILIGREQFLDAELNRRRNTLIDFRCEIVTFDRLLNRARRLDEAEDNWKRIEKDRSFQ